jgi:hypothetical protein
MLTKKSEKENNIRGKKRRDKRKRNTKKRGRGLVAC